MNLEEVRNTLRSSTVKFNWKKRFTFGMIKLKKNVTILYNLLKKRDNRHKYFMSRGNNSQEP